MQRCVVYPGTFDPITNGHIDIITRAAQMFPKIIVAVASNIPKQPVFSLQERIQFTEDAVQHLSTVVVMGFEQLLIDFAKAQGATIILRGLRGVVDFEYEFQLAGMNRKLCHTIDTVFLTPSEDLRCISSSLVREIALLGGDISDFVPTAVVDAFRNKSNQPA